MLKNSMVVWGICGWFATVASAADTNFVSFGKVQAHPTRILARYADHVAVDSEKAAATLMNSGLRVKRRYAVPGLVVLEERFSLKASVNGPAVADAPARRKQLLERIRQLQDSGLFAYVEPDYVVYAHREPNDQAFVDGTLWGLHNEGQNQGVRGVDINATNAWELTTGSTNVIVAVIDTGIRYTHRDLRTQVWRNPGEIPGNGLDDDNNGYVDDLHGINAITGMGDPFDDNDHGTHVSGTIGAAANDGNPHVGVAWEVQIMGCKFLSAQGFGFTSDAITAINYAVANRARILNNSWGGGPFTQALFDSISAVRRAGGLFVASAGNSALNNDGAFPAYPASYRLDNIISVAAINRANRLSVFSNFGRNRVHVGAPGEEIYSSTAGSDTDYSVFDGTSMAAPHVSGIAALIAARHTNSTLVEMRQRILQSALPTVALQFRTTTGGRVDAFRALSAEADGIMEVAISPPSESLILAGSLTPIFVRVSDLFPITNALVSASVLGFTNISLIFTNNGRSPDVVSNDNIYTSQFRVPTNTNSLTIDITVTAAGKTNSTNRVVYTVVPRPVNDDFSGALKIASAGDTVLGTNQFASREPGEPFHAGIPSTAHSLWWNWSAPASGTVLVDTSGSSFDTVLGVYTGTNVANLTEIASVDDVPTRLQGFVTFATQAGTTYRIAVAGFDTNEIGSIRLRVAPNGLPDTNAPIVSITSPLSGANVTTNQIVVSGIAYDPEPGASGIEEVLINVNSGIGNAAIGTTNWTAIVLLREGINTIQTVAGDFAGNVSAPSTITVTYRALDPPNDIFANARPLTGTSGTDSVSTTNAMREFGEPLHGGNEGGRSVWWVWTAPSDGVLTLSTEGSTFDTLLGIYTGDRVNLLEVVAVNDDATSAAGFSVINQGVRGGQTYYLAVDGFAGAFGTAQLRYNFSASGVFRLTLQSTEGGTVTPISGFFPANSTVVLTATPTEGFVFQGFEGGITTTTNPFVIVVTNNMLVTARFAPRSFSDDFGTGDLSRLNWATFGDEPWFVQTVGSGSNFSSDSGSGGSVRSEVPPAFHPNRPFTVTITVTPDLGVGTYFLEDTPPDGWIVSAINENGSFDTDREVVRWGPFFDDRRRTFSYQVTPPINAATFVTFSGLVTFDGEELEIASRESVVVAVRSGEIQNGQTSILQLGSQMQAGILSFDLRVSSEEGWDFLEFYLNGERKERWSGEIGWQTVQFNVPAGFNTVEWRYVKDANTSAGLDAAFIDNLNLPPAAAPVPVGAPRLSAVRNFDGSVLLSLIGQPNQQFTIQASANLATWQTIGTVTTTASGSANIVDPSRGLFTHRFYRAIR